MGSLFAVSRFQHPPQGTASPAPRAQGGALRRTENGYILEQTMHGWYYEPNGKAGDTTVSRRVVEIKANLERIRELVQNVE